MQILLFDIDGTLVWCTEAPKIAINSVFSELYGVDDAFGSTSAHGRTDPLIIQEISRSAIGRELSEEEYREVCSGYIERLSDGIKDCSEYRVLSGVVELLDSLSKEPKIALGLETGNIEEAARLKLSQGDISHYFSFGGYGSDHSERSKIVATAVEKARASFGLDSISPENVTVIGDAPQDVQAAKEYGARSVAVATGRSGVEELSNLNPDLIFEDFSSVKSVLNALLRK